MYRIRLWPLRRDDHSGVLIGASEEQRSDWPAHVLEHGNRLIARARRLIDCTRVGTTGSSLLQAFSAHGVNMLIYSRGLTDNILTMAPFKLFELLQRPLSCGYLLKNSRTVPI